MTPEQAYALPHLPVPADLARSVQVTVADAWCGQCAKRDMSTLIGSVVQHVPIDTYCSRTDRVAIRTVDLCCTHCNQRFTARVTGWYRFI